MPPDIDAATVIAATHLRKTYGKTIAVDDVTFEIREGEIFGLIGPNGAGKTTTMECVEGLRKVDGGAVSVLSLDPWKDSAELQNRIGVQLQQAQLQKRIKVWEAVDLWASLYPRTVDGTALLEQLGLADKREARFMTLSGGQKQRLFIALALIHDPDLVFLDELTTGLDPQALILYPMVAFSGLFFPLELLPPPLQAFAHLLPLTHAVTLLQGIWTGGAWSHYGVEVAALVANFVVCTVLAGKIFRWE